MAEKKIEVEIPATEVKVTSTAKTKKTADTCDITTKEDFKIMYGDRWFYFTKGTVVTVPKELKEFFTKNNIQGYRNANTAFCLEYENEVVMCYTVGHAWFRKGLYDAEIARGACKLGCTVVGGASKLWKSIHRNRYRQQHFHREYHNMKQKTF